MPHPRHNPAPGQPAAIAAPPAALVLIAPAELPDSALPPWTGWDGRSLAVTRVATGEDARALPGDRVAAVAVHAGSVDSVDWAWVQQQYLAGKPVVGFNLGPGELVDLLYPATEGILRGGEFAWTRGEKPFWGPDRLFYSILVAGSRCTSAFTHEYDDGSAPGFVLAVEDESRCSGTPLALR